MERFAAAAFWITVTAYLAFAIWLGSSPDALLSAFGVPAGTPSMRTEIRAFYGGLETGIAATMLILYRRDQLDAALIAGGVPLAGSAAGRLLGCVADGFSAIHLGFAIFESVGAIVCLVSARRVGRRVCATETP